MKGAVFLDRDGTINHDKGGYFHDASGVELFTGVVDGLKVISSLGYRLFVVSNQSGIAKGIFTKEEADVVNRKITSILSKNGIDIEKFFMCPHERADGCKCRKPETKMVTDAAKEFEIDLNESWLIGDKTVDAMTAENVRTLFPGFRFIGVGTGHGMKDAEFEVRAGFFAKNMIDAAKIIKQNI